MSTEHPMTPGDAFAQNETNHVTMYIQNKRPGENVGIIITEHRPSEYEKRDYRMIRRLLLPGVTLHVLVSGFPVSDKFIATLAQSVITPGSSVLHVDLAELGLDPRFFSSYRERNGRK